MEGNFFTSNTETAYRLRLQNERSQRKQNYWLDIDFKIGKKRTKKQDVTIYAKKHEKAEKKYEVRENALRFLWQ